MDTDKHITKNENTYAKKEADIYMQKKKKRCVLKPIFLIHIYIDIDIYKVSKKFNPYKGLMAWRIKLNTGTLSYIDIKVL